MSNFNSRKIFAAIALFVLGCGSALAEESIGTVADHVVGSGTFTSLLDLFTGFCYLTGTVFGIKSTLQLRDHTNNPQQSKLSKPIVSMGIMGTLLALPTFFDALQSTFALTGSGVGGFAGLSAGAPGAAQDLSGMFRAFATNIPALMKMVSFGAICAGAFLILKAIMMLPQVEQGRAEGTKVIWTLISGVALWSLLPFIAASMNTMGMASSDAPSLLMAKYNQTGSDNFDGTIAAVMVFIQLIGLIAFVRGSLILKALADNKDGATGRALAFIFGGAAAMNIAWTVKALAYSIGATSTICGISVNLCA